MLVHIAVADPLVSYANGLATALGAHGVSAEAPSDLEAWAAQQQAKIVFLTLTTESDWKRLETLRLLDDQLLIVAVVDVRDQSLCVRALTSGAVSIVPRDAGVRAVLQIVEALGRGESVVPLSVVRMLAAHLPAADEEPGRETTLSGKEIDWLRQLARGVTVRQLANSAGYSERMMFRILRNVYSRMHVNTRTQALFLAREHGLI